jgi:hypothetical protein
MVWLDLALDFRRHVAGFDAHHEPGRHRIRPAGMGVLDGVPNSARQALQ